MTDTQQETAKFQVQIALEEYKANRAEMAQHLAFQNRITTILASLIPVFVAALLSPQISHYYVWILLSCPFVFSILVLLLNDRDEVIIDLASYQNKKLKPLLERHGGTDMLGWEEYRKAKCYGRGKIRPLAKLLVSPFPHSIFLALSVLACIAVYRTASPSGLVRVCLIIDAIMVAYSSLSAILTTSKYKDI